MGKIGNRGGKGAPFSNYYAEKFKTPKLRADVFDKACKHLTDGYSKASFPPCDWKTLERMMEVYKSEFPSEKIEEAIRQGFLVWEKIGVLGAKGKIKGFSAASWIFNMKNRMGWKDAVELSGDAVIFNFGGDLGKSQFTNGVAKNHYKQKQAEKQ